MHFEGILDFSDAKFLQNTKFHMVYHTAILYKASTGLEQDLVHTSCLGISSSSLLLHNFAVELRAVGLIMSRFL